jgi:TatD DNase family protein
VAARKWFSLFEKTGAFMLIDTHCHIDQFPSPENVVRDCEEKELRVVAVTNLPSHFAMAADRLRGHKYVSAALGMHPLSASEGCHELAAFKRMAPHVNYIGEIGLDFSREGVQSKNIQERIFEEVLCAIQDRPRFITLHSRGAEGSVLDGLRRHSITSAVFHWYSGPAKVLDRVFADGHFISINPAMLTSTSGQRVIAQSPRERILVESDGPFTSVHGRPCSPSDIALVYSSLAARWKVSIQEVTLCVTTNFDKILNSIASASPS